MSSDSDDLESFLDSLRSKKPIRTPSSSSDSLDDFIVDDDHVSFCSDGGSIDSNEEDPVPQGASDSCDLNAALTKLSLSSSDDSSAKDEDSEPNQRRSGGHLSHPGSVPRPKGVLRIQNGRSSAAHSDNKKSLRTPKIVFSSSDSDDCDDDVFWTKDETSESKREKPICGNTPRADRPVHLGSSSAKKSSRILIISDDSDFDSPCNSNGENQPSGLGKNSTTKARTIQKPIPRSTRKLSFSGDDDSGSGEENYTPLVARILGSVGKSVLRDIKNYDDDMPKRKSSEPAPSKPLFRTPARPPPKLCFTEKPKNKDLQKKKRSNGMPQGLPLNCDSGAGFKKHREILTRKMYDHFNRTIFENKLPGDMIVEWNKRLLKTAGTTKCRSRIETTTKGGIQCVSRTYSAMITLSEKVLDSSERLRDTLCHEMCHAAVWLIDHQSEGHGMFWKAWARKALAAHPEMPLIKRCHSYDITYKFSYQCTQCRKIYGRHSKSIKIDKQGCGICRGKLVLLPPTNRDGTPAKTRQPSKFALFVKENYKLTSAAISSGAQTPKHADVMKALSEKFSLLSTTK